MHRSQPDDALPPLSSRQVADVLRVSYRQVDYLARCDRVDLGEGAASGSGSRRRWPLRLVARMEVATRIAALSGRAWPETCEALLAATNDPPPRGWVFLDPRGVVTFADRVSDLLDVMSDHEGGFVCAYEVTPPEAVYAALRPADLDAIPA